MTLTTGFERVELPLENPFTIARGTEDVAETVVVRIHGREETGIGAAAPAPRYDETVDSVEGVLPALLSIVEEVGDPHAHQRIAERMAETAPAEAAARAAVSIALHDLATRRLGVPAYEYWGLDADAAPASSFTISIDDPDRMASAARSAVEAGFSVLKVKVGAVSEDDPARSVRAVREAAPEATIRVDANEAWTSREAIEVIDDIRSVGVEFVEQPVPATDPAGLDEVADHTPVPVAVDESCHVAADVPAIADRADIVVVKLAKTGGLREAVRTIHAAQARGLEVMLGCMVESNASLAAAMHLSPMVSYADLDGSLLLADDPFDGVPMSGGRIDLRSATRAGMGVRE